MRWDRVLSYAEEIQLDLGQNPDRLEPLLPEEIELARVMREEHTEAMKKWHLPR